MSFATDSPSGQIGSGNTFGDAFYPVYKRLFDEDGDFVASVDTKLAEARMGDNVEMFLSKALAVGIIAGGALTAVGLVVGLLLVTVVFAGDVPGIGLIFPEPFLSIIQFLKIPFTVIVSGIVFGSIGFLTGFGSLVSVPYFRSSAREREINTLLSDSVSFMYALSIGGLNQLEILNAMATSEDTYGEVSREFQTIVRETQYFDIDYRTAIRNQALRTPSDELSQFLTDMLSIVNSGGDMTRFLEDQKNKQMRTAQQQQERILDTLELFGEMYMTLSLFPLLLIIILVVMELMTSASQQMLLLGVTYVLIPMISIGFLVVISTVTQDEPGDGFLEPDSDSTTEVTGKNIDVLDFSFVNQFVGEYSIFDKIKSKEGTYNVMKVIKRPHIFFRDYPMTVLIVTVPVSLVALVLALLVGWANLSIEAMTSSPLRETFMWFYLPMYINLVPLTVFYEWNVRSRRGVIGSLSDNLRKLASANETGMTLLESVKVVSDTSSGTLAEEFDAMHAKVRYGTDLKTALREFNNDYHIPRLARTVKLISEAQEASNQIQHVLSTAAQASENQDDIDRERISRTRMQVAIILMTYITLLGVMALLKVQFLEKMSTLVTEVGSTGGDIPGGDMGGQFQSELLQGGFMSMLFFHAVTIQALASSFIAGYVRDIKILAGTKYAVALTTLALIVWIAVTNMGGA
ncbi:MAG: type II secretion system F family protein [Halococcoides sp.]